MDVDHCIMIRRQWESGMLETKKEQWKFWWLNHGCINENSWIFKTMKRIPITGSWLDVPIIMLNDKKKNVHQGIRKPQDSYLYNISGVSKDSFFTLCVVTFWPIVHMTTSS